MPAAWQFGNGNGNGVALNNGAGVLAGDASVTISNAATLGSPTVPRFMILIDSELIEVDAVAGNVYSSLQRGQEGTTAASHASNATVFLSITAGMMTGAFLRADQVNAVEVTGTDFKPSGLAGSTAASRFIGGTAAGGPASGTQAAGDFGSEQDGRLWVVSAPGTPGTSRTTAMQELANTFTQAQTFPQANGIVMGSGANKLTLNDQQTTAQTLNLPNIRETETVAVVPQQSFSTPVSPAGTTSTVGVMAGIAGAITPQVTGRILIILVGTVLNNTASDGTDVQLRYGTGAAPANGAALVGTAVGVAVRTGTTANTANIQFGFALLGIATGLILGTAYWIDVMEKAINGGTSSLFNLSLMVMEI